MPQMAPLNWLTLMISFSMILIMFNTINFYSFSYQIQKSKTKIKTMKTNWKW
uniref:ATP synthase complex subunit 8 n=1 Tax=Tenebrionidae sp. 1 ACP-2013 TaxID=1434595 RepID=A0A3G3FXD0_9CUCU|nr:ATP synthase F0 subunit 8 [Tenebrionidae sp. 1 ACP-2013]